MVAVFPSPVVVVVDEAVEEEEELVAVLMTQVLGSSERLRETYSALVYQAIDD